MTLDEYYIITIACLYTAALVYWWRVEVRDAPHEVDMIDTENRLRDD